MRTRIFFIIVLIQILIVASLLIGIPKKANDTMGVYTNTIDSDSIIQTSSNSLKNFYEPKADTIEEDHADWLNYVPKYSINADALNERFNYSVIKPNNVYRIITLGDSFTFGENVDTKDNYPEQLEDLLNTRCQKKKFEVINLGVQGYDIQYMIERYKKRGVKYQPDLIVSLFGDFQLYRINVVLADIVNKIRISDPKKNQVSINIEAGIQLIKTYGWDNILKWQSQQISDLLASAGNSMILILKYPVGCQYDSNIMTVFGQKVNCDPFIKYNDLFKQAISKKKNAFFLNNFKWKEEYDLKDGHPNVAGHKAIAEDIFQYLTKNKLIPCN